MKPEGRDYLAAADVLRVVCIGLIGWYHIWQQSWLDPSFTAFGYYVNIQNVVRHGYLLVDVVLVISGFLLSLPHARARCGLGDPPGVKEYYVKRFWRIVPSYVLAVLLVFFLYALPQKQYWTEEFMVRDLLSHLTFTHNLFYDTYFGTPLPIVLWTLGVEVQFYLVFPLVGRLFERRPLAVCLGMTLIALVYRAFVYPMEDTTFYVNQLPGMLDLYACGMLAGLGYVRLSRRNLPGGLRWALALCALLALSGMMQLLYHGVIGDYGALRRQQLVYRLPLGVLAGIFLLGGCLVPAGLGRALGNPLTRFLSAISYNFYIWHQFLAVRLKARHIPAYVSELPNQSGEQPWMTRYTWLCFAAAVAAGALVTYLWEKPAARLGAKRRTADDSVDKRASKVI